MPSSHANRSVLLRIIIWFFVALLIVGFGIFQVQLYRKYNRLVLAQLNAIQQQRLKDDQAEVVAESVYARAQLGRQATVRDAEVALNGGRPFPTTQAGSIAALVYTDPASGGTALLRYEGTRWIDVTTPMYPFPGTPAVIRRINLARSLAYAIGYIVWPFVFSTLIGAMYNRPSERHTPLAIDLLMLAIFATALALLGPYPRDALYRFFRGDSAAAWGWLMIPASFVALVFAIRRSRERNAPFPRCASCGYNLTGNRSGVCPECGETVTAIA